MKKLLSPLLLDHAYLSKSRGVKTVKPIKLLALSLLFCVSASAHPKDKDHPFCPDSPNICYSKKGLMDKWEADRKQKTLESLPAEVERLQLYYDDCREHSKSLQTRIDAFEKKEASAKMDELGKLDFMPDALCREDSSFSTPSGDECKCFSLLNSLYVTCTKARK